MQGIITNARLRATAFTFACNHVCFHVQMHTPLITNKFASPNRQQTRLMPCRDPMLQALLKWMTYKCKVQFVCTLFTSCIFRVELCHVQERDCWYGLFRSAAVECRKHVCLPRTNAFTLLARIYTFKLRKRVWLNAQTCSAERTNTFVTRVCCTLHLNGTVQCIYT